MKIFEERRQLKRYLYSKPVLVLLLLLIVVLVRAVWHSYLGAKFAKNNLRVAETESRALEMRVNTLETDLAKLQTDRGLEEALRSKYGVARPEEEVIILVDPKDNSANVSSQNSSFWQTLLDWFLTH